MSDPFIDHVPQVINIGFIYGTGERLETLKCQKCWQQWPCEVGGLRQALKAAEEERDENERAMVALRRQRDAAERLVETNYQLIVQTAAERDSWKRGHDRWRKRAEEAERRIWPDQGHGYENEVERQRHVIEQLQNVVRNLEEEIKIRRKNGR